MARAPGYSSGHKSYRTFFYERQSHLRVCVFDSTGLGKNLYGCQYGIWSLVYFDKTIQATRGTKPGKDQTLKIRNRLINRNYIRPEYDPRHHPGSVVVD